MAEVIGLLSWDGQRVLPDASSLARYVLEQCREVASEPLFFYPYRLEPLLYVTNAFVEAGLACEQLAEEYTPQLLVKSKMEKNVVLFCQWTEFVPFVNDLDYDKSTFFLLRSRNRWRHFEFAQYERYCEKKGPSAPGEARASVIPPKEGVKPKAAEAKQIPLSPSLHTQPEKNQLQSSRLLRASFAGFSPELFRSELASNPVSEPSTELRPGRRTTAIFSSAVRDSLAQVVPSASESMQPRLSVNPSWLSSSQKNTAGIRSEGAKSPMSATRSPYDQSLSQSMETARRQVEQKLKSVSEVLQKELAQIPKTETTAVDPKLLAQTVNQKIQAIASAKEEAIRTACRHASESFEPLAKQCADDIAQLEANYQNFVAEINLQNAQKAAALVQSQSDLCQVGSEQLAEGIRVIEAWLTETTRLLEETRALRNPPLQVLTALTATGPVMLIRWKTWQEGSARIVRFEPSQPGVQFYPQSTFLCSELEIVPFSVDFPTSILILGNADNPLSLEGTDILSKEFPVTNFYQETPQNWSVDIARYYLEQTVAYMHYAKSGGFFSSTVMRAIKEAIEEEPGSSADYYLLKLS